MVHKYEKFLVTGGAGFIGSHIVDRLLNEGFEVTVIDNLDTGCLENVAHHKGNKRFHFIKGDIRDFNLAKETMKDIDAVFHEAALANVSLSVQNPVLANDINVTGTVNLLKTSLDAGVKRFIYASSAAVYGHKLPDRKREDVATDPASPYGVSKLAAEYYVRLFHTLFDLGTVSLRYFNVYGPRQRCDTGCAYGGVITIFIRRSLENMPLIIYGDGEQTRDFVYVQDVVEANMLALNNRNAVGEVFNIGTGRNTSINRLAELLKEIMGKKNIKNTYADPRPSDVRHGYAGTTKAKETLGYTSRFSLKEGLTELVALASCTRSNQCRLGSTALGTTG
jgi:nucleoside-diphosphate-sugar epimerase